MCPPEVQLIAQRQLVEDFRDRADECFYSTIPVY